ncbi:MAG TPA: hypothetical protein V6C89_20490 [Drouetiella sp.]|jgi:hypothetical protein
MASTTKISSLEAQCTENQARALLEDFKASACNGWFFETYRFIDDGRMVYKFFLIDLNDQLEQNENKYVRYHGWLEVVEEEGAIVVKPGGSLEPMLDPALKQMLLTRFYEDVMEPVCKRHRVVTRTGV